MLLRFSALLTRRGVAGLRRSGELNARRKKFVRMAFNVLDKDGSGDITIQGG